jgi:crossover junction endodeoxyribonuclease RuvC
MIIFGIDPGLTGAIAVFMCGEFYSKFEAVYDMPITPTGKGGSKVLNQVDAHALGQIIAKYTNNNIHVVAYLERVHTMPLQGVASNGSLMHSLGVVEGALGMASIKTVMVTPQKWKKHWGLIGTAKSAAVDLAKKEFPESGIKLKKHSGKADAVLIGAFGAKYNKFLEA